MGFLTWEGTTLQYIVVTQRVHCPPIIKNRKLLYTLIAWASHNAVQLHASLRECKSIVDRPPSIYGRPLYKVFQINFHCLLVHCWPRNSPVLWRRWWFIEKGYVSWARYIIQRKAPRESKPKTTLYSDRACRTSTTWEWPIFFRFHRRYCSALLRIPRRIPRQHCWIKTCFLSRDTPAGDLIQSGLEIRTRRREDCALTAEQVTRLEVGVLYW